MEGRVEKKEISSIACLSTLIGIMNGSYLLAILLFVFWMRILLKG